MLPQSTTRNAANFPVSIPGLEVVKKEVNMLKVNVINNWAFSFKVPLTLHIVFRAGSLVTNLLLSRLILKRQFSRSKYISVATITLGK